MIEVVIESLGLSGEGDSMRWIYFVIIVLFAAATLIFALQNLEIVTVSFLSFQARKSTHSIY